MGYKVSSAQYEKEHRKELEHTIAYYERILKQNEQINADLTKELYAARRATRHTTEEVIRYVEKNPNLSVCELDDAGLRLWNGEPED